MTENEPVATVYDIRTARHDEVGDAPYGDVARFVADHPCRGHLRIEGKGLAQPLTADEFLMRFPASGPVAAAL